MTTRAIQIEVLADPLIDPTTGGLCSGYTAYFYAAGTSTAKNVWTEKEKTNPFTSYLLDSGGKILLYGDGIYKIVVKNTAGTTVLSLDNQKIQANTFSVVQKIGTYSATPDDDVVLCSGTFTVTIGSATYPAPSSFEHPLIFKNIGSGSITLDPYGSVNIDAAATKTLVPGDSVTLYPDGTSEVWRSTVTLTDVDGQEFILDADGDTSITADTDDQIDIKVGGTDRAQLTNTSFIIKPSGTARVTVTDTSITLAAPLSGFDANGSEMIIDADADTSITADTDDQIDFKVGNTDRFKMTTSGLLPSADNAVDIGSVDASNVGLRIKAICVINEYVSDSTYWWDGSSAFVKQGRDITAAIHRKIVEIGDWNMDSTGTVLVSHGLTGSKIRSISGVIRNDANDAFYPMVTGYPESAATANINPWISNFGATTIGLGRYDSSIFDTVNFDSTSYNRGWLIIDYVD